MRIASIMGAGAPTPPYAKDEVVANLLQTLADLGIEPLGSESVDNTIWVHSKEVDPFLVEQMVIEAL
jgi:hypothetical protein